MVGTNDLDKSRKFYDAVLGALGHGPGLADDKGHVFWLTPTMAFGVSIPINGEPACRANGGTIGFVSASREQVDAWHDAGVAHGGQSCEDPPGIRTHGEMRSYAAYLRDPDGNKLCVMHPIPA